MAQSTGRFGWVSKVSLATLICTIVLLAIMLADTVAAGVAHVMKQGLRPWPDMIPYARDAAAILVGAGVAFMLYGMVHAILATQMAAGISAGRTGRIESLLSGQRGDLRELLNLASLSDRAKSLVYRDKEIAALRETAHHDIIKQDYEAVEAMLDGLETDLGYAGEASLLREELEKSRRGTLDEKIDAAIARIQTAVDARDWDRALRQAQRVIELFPDKPKVQSLPQRVIKAKAKHKRNLLEAYDAAVGKKDVDLGINLLRELDLYLSPQEAAALEESARGVFRAKLHNLGVQFAIRVTDQSWSEALAVGEQIMAEYPNSRMAQEVQEKIDLLRARASAVQPTG